MVSERLNFIFIVTTTFIDVVVSHNNINSFLLF